ncbi:alginate lyase family protein [Natroniella acetigena]|uniref:alginate lyase family protein n=1 Tax=Natroniella acetigena TaxID=52004 RepID=UPI00200A7542|nr:alginate lyase family protein [Natroniella acetigena]
MLQIDSSKFDNFKTRLNFFFSIRDKEKMLQYYSDNLKIKKKIIKSADKICDHKFDLLGSGLNDLGEDIKWNQDFKTGFIWENKFYKDIEIVNLNNNADVKVPWELSRFQHLFTLGKAYWITNNQKYYKEFKKQIEDWIEKNPIEMSINWTCTMDVAIRAVNWIYAYFLFEDKIDNDKKFKNKLNSSLYSHGKFIYKNLENKGKFNNNHYLSNLVGLIFLGLYFGDFKLSKFNKPEKWLNYGLSELEKEMFIQNNEDGTNYETSTSYHRLVTELFLFPTILAEKNGYNFSDEYMNRLELMFNFIMSITKPNGKAPLIGDADNGRLVIFSNYYGWEKSDFRHLLSIGGVYFNRDDFKYLGQDYQEDCLWTLGKTYTLKKLKKANLKSKVYKQGGYYILRNDSIYCVVRCGELSLRGQGGHSHNDQLSFELNVNGNDFIIDPGVYVYTADYKMRNLYRSTKMHNTLYIEGFEQNDFYEKDLFNMKEQSFAECLEFNDTIFLGEHSGYKHKPGVIHRRRIELKENKLIIEDNLLGDLKRDAYVILNLSPEVDLKEEENSLILTNKSEQILLQNIENYSVQETLISYSYGEKLISKKILINIKQSNKLKISREGS